ncbi:HNH endonuclease [Bifidobacterium gallicum]|uniref:Restriction endonuclease R.BbrI n=1 Tax=Bifidobacterium gallicum DSM 20093 = LMG 11596 TaxID=561180 RepID=D1NWA4_9BIFI|nr:HNH endonuclease [Bifidobacterium gallicum]EFA22390.1 hypothetical protein BIFGAL_04151 [Bifidobacterium gallicum DSM 20093 = LMG 11596]KFI60091.1 restriction endonuclease R.BbrI [Bifidobacterium gallicum DSM 20093 = LMG 11596]
MATTRPSAWTLEETMLAFGAYLLVPPNKFDKREPLIQMLAQHIHRTTGAVALKLANLLAKDPFRNPTGSRGMAHGSKRDAEVWEMYQANPDSFSAECIAKIKEAIGKKVVENALFSSSELEHIIDKQLASQSDKEPSEAPEGENGLHLTTYRINQNYFRNSLLRNYGNQCCITGIDEPELLIASHIKPWAQSDATERTATSNGLLLNALHDRAFDQGLLTLDEDYRVVIAVEEIPHSEANDRWFYAFEGKQISMPRVPPSQEFLRYHNDHVFQGVV